MLFTDKYFFIQSRPSVNRVTSIEQVIFPVEFRSVAGISIMVLIIISVPANCGEKPNIEQISNSPVMPPLGIAPTTTPTSKAAPIIIKALEDDVSSCPNKVNKKIILIIPPITEPSLCIFVPKGMTVSAILEGTPIFFEASILIGIQAALDDVAIAIKDGVIIFFQKAVRALLPPAKNT